MYDILLKNGMVIDGTGKQVPKKFDIGIKDGKIADIDANIKSTKGKVLVDASNHFVSPGFIDIQNHSDSYWTIFDQPEQTSLLSQGITTIVMGNCGSSLAPLPTREAIKTVQKWHELAGVNVNWASFAEFLKALQQRPVGVNVASLIGHATLRRGLIGDAVREISYNELQVMDRLLEEGLNQGAFGLSLGLVYAHEVDSSFNELKEITNNLSKQNKYLSVHLRSEGSHILEAVDEAIELAKTCNVPVKISHLKIRGQKNWHLFGLLINKLETAYHQGLDVSFDVYPYDTSWSVLYTYLPKWAYEGGRTEILKRLALPNERRKILDYLRLQDNDFSKIVIATAESGAGFIGKSITQIASNQNVSLEETLLNIISANNAQVVVFDHNLSNEHVEAFLTSPLSLIGTDGAGYTKPAKNLVHPRCFGTIPKFLSMVRQNKILKWEQAIKKLTSEPARILGIKDRGLIAKGLYADLVVFDPIKITDKATFEQPYQISQGVHTVLVNGKIAFAENQFSDFAGKVLSR